MNKLNNANAQSTKPLSIIIAVISANKTIFIVLPKMFALHVPTIQSITVPQIAVNAIKTKVFFGIIQLAFNAFILSFSILNN